MKLFQILLVTLFLALFNIVTVPAASLEEQGGQALTTMQQLTEKININTATLEELTEIPGVGPKTAEKIIEYREIHGKFKQISDLVNIKGIGEKKLSMMEDYITL